MRLLDTNGGNLKLKKTAKHAGGNYRLAGLSLYPDPILCPGSKAADCMADCLKSAGRGAFSNVTDGRQKKADFWHRDRAGFLDQLNSELFNFSRLCDKTGVRGAVRLNVLSDIDWENHGVPQNHPGLTFYDYTKRAIRLSDIRRPDNYSLMFSYSGHPAYRKQVTRALQTDCPVAVVFRVKAGEPLPAAFMGRPVIDGDISDLVNVTAGPVIIGLRAKGRARQSDSAFIVDPARAALVAA